MTRQTHITGIPIQDAKTIPNSWYFDDEVYEIEKEIFLDSWQMVGNLESLAKTGDYITCTIADEPISVVKDESGKLSAFYNVCKHKAAAILVGCGNIDRMRCDYHGWTYDLQGRLKGITEFDGVNNFCREENGLQRLKVELFGPLVFVTNTCEYSLQDLTKEIQLRPWRATELSVDYTFYKRLSYDLKCNWKVFVDNYLDGGYHVNCLHKDLASVLDYKNYHTKLLDKSNVQISPFKKDDSLRGGDNAYYWWLFPNLMINIYKDTFDINLVVPTSKETCTVHIDFFFNPLMLGEWSEKSVELCDKIQKEDIGICESVQRGLKSRSYQFGRYSVKRETGIHHFHELLANEINSYEES